MEDTESPPLSHESDMAFLDWMRACNAHHTDPKSLKHIFLSIILNDTTKEVVKKALANKSYNIDDDWVRLPSWDGRVTFELDSKEGRAVLATFQVKGIMWMLIQHRHHLGMKKFKRISVFKDSDPEREVRGPSVHLELEDIH